MHTPYIHSQIHKETERDTHTNREIDINLWFYSTPQRVSKLRSMASTSTFALLLVVLVASDLPRMKATIACSAVYYNLSGCLLYVEGKVAAPSASCCTGISSLYNLTKSSRPDRITACGCIKSEATALGRSLKPSSVAVLPGKCGVPLGYTPSLSVNCSTIP